MRRQTAAPSGRCGIGSSRSHAGAGAAAGPIERLSTATAAMIAPEAPTPVSPERGVLPLAARARPSATQQLARAGNNGFHA